MEGLRHRPSRARRVRPPLLHTPAGGLPLTWTEADTERSVPAAFEEVARRHGAKPAIAGTAWQPTFAELDAAADRIATGVLGRAGDSPGRVALVMRHDAPAIAALLGALKAGKTAVALNPSDPPARLEQVLAEAEPQLVLTDADLPDGSGRPSAVADAGDVAVLIYTSGSTGRPHGVMQTHRNVLHNVLRHTNALGVRAEDRVVLLAAISGGQGLGTVFTTLLNGATLCPFPIMGRGMTGLAAWLAEQAISVFVAPASVFRHFTSTLNGQPLPSVRLVRLGSEPALQADFEAYRRHFSERCLLANTFSSSETGSISHCLLDAYEGEPGARLPVGRPAESTEVVVVDEHGAAVPPGQTGEIVVRGDHISPGYWRNEELTARRFNGGAFHTGDLGHFSEDGLLTVTGRKDAQVKVRGYRVDPSEVEAALSAHPDVAAAGVSASASHNGDARLTAYVAAQPGTSPGAASLRDWLGRTLPNQAVPTAFEFLDALPLTSHGKVDRDRLAEMTPTPEEDVPGRRALSGTEELLAGIWAGALGRPQIGPDQDFFDLGGDSLTAAAIAAEIHAAFGVELDLRAFAGSPTVAEMSQLVESAAAAPLGGRPPLTPAPRSARMPCSFMQEHVWRSSQTPEGSAAWNAAAALSIRGPLDIGALRRAVDRIFRRHEVLRTTFTEHDGRPFQVVHDAAPVELPLIDLTAEPDPAVRAAALLAEQAGAVFDLGRGPLLRLLLVRLGADEHRLLRTSHHLIGDGWSWRVFFRELAALYEADIRGDPPPLPEDMELQYADFADWERRCLDPAGERFRDEVAWWRKTLEGDPGPMPLPFTRAESEPDARPSDGVIWWELEPEVALELEQIAARAGATFYMLGVATLAAQLAFDTGRHDVVLGTYATNRRLPELQAMFGFFANLTTLRLQFSPELSFHGWLARVRATVLETSAHTEIPHQLLCEELQRFGVALPEARAIFAASMTRERLDFGGLEIEQPKHTFSVMPHGFSFAVGRRSSMERCVALFDARLHDPDQVRAFIDRYRHLSDAASRRPDAPLSSLL